MTSEVQKIFETVEEYSSSQDLRGFFAESKVERTLLSVLVASFVAMLFFFFYKPLQEWAIMSGLVFLLTVVALAIVQALEAVAVIRSPLKGYAQLAEKRLNKRVAFVDKLATFEPEALQMALQALEGDASRIQKRLYSLVGAIEKAGFVPAAIALYFASTKIMAGSSDHSANFLMAAIFGLYGGAFLGHRIIETLLVSVSCLQEARDLSEKRKRLSGA